MMSGDGNENGLEILEVELIDIMKRMGFEEKWCKWVDSCLRSSSMSILVNGSPSEEFVFEKGVRQGDPLSPFLFILATEGLNAIVTEAVEKGIFRGVVNKENAKSLMYILKCFEEVSGLKVNYNKSKIYGIEVNKEDMADMARWLRCGIGKIPFTYLGLPIGENMRRVNAWGQVVEKFKNRLADWKAKTMSFGGRLTLIGAEIEGMGIELYSSFRGILGDGRDIRFWVDMWVDNQRSCDRFPRLYHLDIRKEGEFEELLDDLQNIVVHSSCRDKWRWELDEDGEFTIKELTRLVEDKILHVENGGHETI
ncbi:reverse transcriptase domain, reverse transcriptase zinc-binding domain protein [Tanacetum coccineum]